MGAYVCCISVVSSINYMLYFSVIVNFPLEEDPEVSMIAWTTTPWTLPSNMALCVNPVMTYVKVKGKHTRF